MMELEWKCKFRMEIALKEMVLVSNHRFKLHQKLLSIVP